ncbi:uncharacterized protein LOC131875942 [Cryptomeria japonica]|uniref:uncharacterized protein LOC131875942 n=1 Tax=Cryptomeria japonica TaxID=3369 RepID=UPI0027DA2CDE|nr:uncharacterized protein LOC131875942 [Cryptomeria japonica]
MGAFGGLAFLWKDMTIDLKLVASTPYWMLALVRSRVSNIKLWLFNVYGPMSIGGKKALWDSLSLTLSPLHGQLVVFGGDFNAISFDDEKCGGILPNKRILEDFSTFILNNDLVDFLPYVGLDHFPVLLSIFDDKAPSHSSFKFKPMWFRDPSFLLILQSWWSVAPYVHGSRMFRFAKNLSYLKLEIKKWNVLHFKNIFSEKAKIREELEALNDRFMNGGMDFATLHKHKSLNSQLEEILSKEEIYWQQKSKDLWLSDGDRNTKFFHASTKLKCQRCRISSIQNSDGVVLTEEPDIVNEGAQFFKSLLPEELSVFSDNFASSIPKLIIDEDNAMLMAPFSIQEVKDVVFSMSPKKAPGPGGFTTLFFQKCWSFLGEDLRLVLEEARCNRTMLRELNSTLIALIPKCENPKSFVDFCPIVLCNILYKIITQAISLKLANLNPKIISVIYSSYDSQIGYDEGPRQGKLAGTIVCAHEIWVWNQMGQMGSGLY